MSTADLIAKNNFNWHRENGASEIAIAALKKASAGALPPTYCDFLSVSNGGEGELPMDPLWFILWSAEEVLEFNQHFEVAKYAPGFFGFGDNGNNEILAFDLRLIDSSTVFTLPMIGMRSDQAMLVSPDFETFISCLGMPEDPSEYSI